MVLGKEYKQGVRIVPLTTTDADDKIAGAQVTGFDESVIDIANCLISSITVPGQDETAVEYFTNQIGGDTELRIIRNKKIFDMNTDALAASADGSLAKVAIKMYLTVAQQLAIQSLVGRACAFVFFLEDTTGATKLEFHLCAAFSGDIEFSSENGMMKIENEFVGKPVTIDGGSTVTVTEYNSEVTSTGVAQTGGTAVTPTDLNADDFTKFLTGQFVIKETA